ncbi:MAG: hypothetical protein H8D45_05625 [Bacteroidetes bacterium]|nr:hypothetical protein [Bacteroidota bacterium]
MNYIVIYDDRRVDKEVKLFKNLNEAVLSCENWIKSKGYNVEDFESMDWRDQDVGSTALMGWYSDFDRDVEIFKQEEK